MYLFFPPYSSTTLIDIKCRMLLPKEVNEDGEEEDPRAELVQKLLEYKMFKYMSFELRDRLVDAEKNYYRGQQLPEEVAAYRQPVDYGELIGDMNLLKLRHPFVLSVAYLLKEYCTCFFRRIQAELLFCPFAGTLRFIRAAGLSRAG